ncbi:transposase domain-containing protein, partial [Escherichia coli]
SSCSDTSHPRELSSPPLAGQHSSSGRITRVSRGSEAGNGLRAEDWLFARSDSGGEHAAALYSQIGTCRLDNVEPEKWLRYVIEHTQDRPANRVRDLLPWKVDLTSQ